MTEAKPILTVIAGPNGSGKSTFTRSINEALQVPVIDPDTLARLIKPNAPEEAAIQGERVCGVALLPAKLAWQTSDTTREGVLGK